MTMMAANCHRQQMRAQASDEVEKEEAMSEFDMEERWGSWRVHERMQLFFSL